MPVFLSQHPTNGHDSYEFAKEMLLKLPNGGRLLDIYHKNGKEGFINVLETKEFLKEYGSMNPHLKMPVRWY